MVAMQTDDGASPAGPRAPRCCPPAPRPSRGRPTLDPAEGMRRAGGDPLVAFVRPASGTRSDGHAVAFATRTPGRRRVATCSFPDDARRARFLIRARSGAAPAPREEAADPHRVFPVRIAVRPGEVRLLLADGDADPGDGREEREERRPAGEQEAEPGEDDEHAEIDRIP